MIAELPVSRHNLVLNKFAIVPEHFILSTAEFHPQTDLLEGLDLAATYACIEAYHKSCAKGEMGSNLGEGELFAFFNSGDFSGSSQPHRHIQLLPVARMREGLDGAEWDVLAHRLVGEVKDLPFTTFAEHIEPGMTPEALRAAYLRLYRHACAAVAAFTHKPEIAEGAEKQTAGEAKISYNLAMTRHALIVCPRLAEGGPIWDNGEVIGKLSMNGTVLAGTALVKNQVEWDALRNDPNELLQVLVAIGVPKRFEAEVN
jgi:ATP adenylyltransferase